MGLFLPTYLSNQRPAGPLVLNGGCSLANGVVACWPLSGSFGLGKDLSQRPQPLTAFNGATMGARPLTGMSAKFDGTSNYMSPSSLVGIPNISGPKTLAIRSWVDPSVSTPTAMNYFTLAKDDTGSASNSVNLQWGAGAGFWEITVEFWGGGTVFSSFLKDTTNAVAPQRWVDVVYTYDGSTNHALYLDGVLANTSAAGQSQTGAVGLIRLASFNSAFPSPYFKGWLADATIVNRVWTAAEVFSWSDPRTRWDLYWQPSNTAYFFVGTATGSVVALSGAGNLAAVGAASAASVAAMSGAGVLTLTGAAQVAAVATLFGSGTLTGVGSAIAASVAALFGSGVLTLVGLSTAAGVASMSGVGALQAAGAAVAAAVAALSGSGTESATGAATAASVAALSGSGTLSATGAAIAAAVAALAGAGGLSGVGAAIAASVATLTGAAGTLSAVAFGGANGVGALGGVGILSAVGASLSAAVVALSGAGTTTESGASTAAAVTAMSGAGGMPTTGAAIAASVAALSGSSTLNTLSNTMIAAIAALGGTSALFGSTTPITVEILPLIRCDASGQPLIRGTDGTQPVIRCQVVVE